VIVDPSHATGKRSLVPPVSRAAIAAGADGLLIEMHPHPEEALCDGDQSITPDMLHTMMKELDGITKAIGRTI
jgi:3-deoxy-7-phosphoheptulonate synthase